MSNINISESTTENIFREYYGIKTFVEKSAINDGYGFKSKNETGKKGYPDFFLDKNDYVIIVEAKAINHNEAKEQIKYYMNNNEINNKDIIGIAITGQNKEEIQIDYYIKLNCGNIEEIEDKNYFLSLHSIEKIYRKKKYGESLTDEKLNLY